MELLLELAICIGIPIGVAGLCECSASIVRNIRSN